MIARTFVPLVLNPPPNITLVSSIADLEKIDEFLKGITAVGHDIETNFQKDFWFRRLRTTQFGTGAKQFVIDLLGLVDGDSDLLFKAQGEYGKHLHLHPNLPIYKEFLQDHLCNRKLQKIGVNLSFEYQQWYWNFGIRMEGLYCTSTAEKCIWAGAHSLKDYGFFSMEEMVQRYLGYQIDKTLQTSFNLEDPISQAQIEYAAQDTRIPITIKFAQDMIAAGETYASLMKQGWPKRAELLKYIDPRVTGDRLREVIQLENDFVCVPEEMHVHGDVVDVPRWLTRVTKAEARLKELMADTLDPFFIPLVGNKSEIITEEQIAQAKAEWKAYNIIPADETALAAEIRLVAKTMPGSEQLLINVLAKKVELRKAKKEALKLKERELGKRRTAINKLAAECEGEALINYSSDTQLLKVLKEIKGCARLNSMEDDALAKFEDKHYIIAAIRELHTLLKDIGTYGRQWATQWVTHPCKEEGWLHPQDGKIHSTLNPYDAETGRTSSEKPNEQNLPQDKEVRQSFIAEPDNENIRISTCCDGDTQFSHDLLSGNEYHICTCCKTQCATRAEDYSLITCDMSGAELRIIAELSGDKVWIEAFSKGQDVHSVGTEILYADKWPLLALPDCAYYKKLENGELARQKCKCPEHSKLRDATKAVNFLLAYGGGPHTLAARIGVSVGDAVDIMALHERKFPAVWKYLKESGDRSKKLKKSFDMYGRRRLYTDPTREIALKYIKKDSKDSKKFEIDLTKEEKKAILAQWKSENCDKELTDEVEWDLLHTQPTPKDLDAKIMRLIASIERQGKNMCIQGTNASIAKLALGQGYDLEGKPFLWHILPKYGAKMIKFVHDEIVIQCPTRFAKIVAELIQDAFRRAAAVKMKKVVMEAEFNISKYWSK